MATRRSTRIKKPTTRFSAQSASTQTASRSARPLVPRDALDGFMVKLYAEIHAAAVTPISHTERSDIHDVLRKARTVRFFRRLHRGTRDRVTEKLQSPRPSTRQTGGVQQHALDTIQMSPLTFDRLRTFSSLLLLSICAHSETFRTALSHEDTHTSSRANRNPSWKDISQKLQQSSSSLELFAKTRGLDWRGALAAHDDDFGILLGSILRNLALPTDINQTNLGIAAHDLIEKHQVDSSSPYHWVLPPRKKAFRCRITYKVTQDLIDDDTRARTANPNSSAPALQLDEDKEADQLNIANSIILPHYTWPKLAAAAAGDPRFCGFVNNPCEMCDRELSCFCTAADAYNDSEPIVELITTDRTGTGVRALREIANDDHIGEYVGEIYPAKYNRHGGHISRYEGEAGHSYILDVAIAQAKDEVGGPTRKSSAPKTSGAKATATKGAKGSAATKTTSRQRRPAFLVDSAIKGNWTRYINHSCKPNTQFHLANIGQKRTVLIKTLRRIHYGEELTVHYGDEYFKYFDWGCKCGHANCKLWREGQGALPDKVTLKMAKNQGIAPKWAMDDDNVPY